MIDEVRLERMVVTLYGPEETADQDVLSPHMQHGAAVKIVDRKDDDVSACDALMTRNRNLKLGMRTADCAPICFATETEILIAHVGWRGLCGNMIEHALAMLTGDAEIYVGPHLFSFQIQKDFCYDAITEKFGTRFMAFENDTILFKFKDAIASLIPNAHFDRRNTGESIIFPSYRRDRTPKRFTTTLRFKE